MPETPTPSADLGGLEQLLASLSEWEKVFDPQLIPATLYHYTTFEGLQGIAKENALRATFGKSLNDSSEGEFGKTIVSKYADAVSRERHRPPLYMTLPAPESMFVTCFCEDGDLLSMWRCYSAQGGGYCLGFDGPQVAELDRSEMKAGEYAARPVKVFYGEAGSKSLGESMATGAHMWAEWAFENMIKHGGFAEEKEWRVLVPAPPVSQMSFHSSYSGIKASVQIRHRSGKLPLKTVRCGPTVRPETQTVVKWMLEKYGYPEVTVSGCEIPYRL